MGLKIVSFNVRGLNSPFRRSMLWRNVLKSHADIICLQETHFLATDLHRLKHKKCIHSFHSTAPVKKAGVSIFVKDTVAFQLSSTIDPKGRFIIINCMLNSIPYTLVSLYAPNTRQKTFIKNTVTAAKEIRQGGLIVCGDFNAVVDNREDRSIGSFRHAQEIHSIVAEEELHDVWRYLNNTERDYTYFSSSKRTHSRIDFFLVDRSVLSKTDSASIGNITWSDHAPIALMLRTKFDTRGRPPWRLNSFLLKDPENLKFLTTHLQDFFKLNNLPSTSPTLLWCTHKAYIRGLFIQLAAKQKRLRDQKLSQLLADIRTADKAFKDNPSDSTKYALKDLQTKLRALYLHKYDYNLAKLRWNFYLQGDRPGKILARRVKQQQANRRIPYMYTSRNEKVYDPQIITNIFADYYKGLYNIGKDPSIPPVTPIAIDSFLSKMSLPTLSVSQITHLNSPLTITEIHQVINTSKSFKSPGPDGLPSEYYQAFKEILSPHLLATCSAIIEKKSPPAEMLQAIITTIHKSGKTSDSPANFRPISLLNNDLKFFSKILANRLNQILPSLIHSDQVGFLKHRQTRDGTRRLLDLIQLATSSAEDSALLSLDAEKAFDRVQWLYLQKVLTKFGFSGFIYDAICSLYTCPSASVFSAVFLSYNFPISNGTRQGSFLHFLLSPLRS